MVLNKEEELMSQQSTSIPFAIGTPALKLDLVSMKEGRLVRGISLSSE